MRSPREYAEEGYKAYYGSPLNQAGHAAAEALRDTLTLIDLLEMGAISFGDARSQVAKLLWNAGQQQAPE